jgi:hypothetical protein
VAAPSIRAMPLTVDDRAVHRLTADQALLAALFAGV